MKTKLISLILLSFLSACSFSNIKGNGNLVVKNIDAVKLSEIKEIEAGGAFEINVNIADTSSLQIITDKNLLQYIQFRISGDKLIIDTKENLSPTDGIKINLTLPHLIYVDLSGANDLYIKNLNEEKFIVSCSGSSSIKISGTVSEFTADISGSANLNSLNLKANKVILDISGAADAVVYANKILRVSASGSTDVEYAGNPEIVNTDISGAGSVSKYFEKKK